MRMAGDGLAALNGVGMMDFGTIGGSGIEGSSLARIAGHESESKVHGYGMKSVADLIAAEHMADAEMAIGRTQGNAAMMSGLFEGISGLAGGAIKGAAGGGGGNNRIPGVEGQDSTTHYGWNAPASQYEPGAISTPGWTWDDL